MDTLLYHFYSRKLYIDATGATVDNLLKLEEQTKLRWTSGNEIHTIVEPFKYSCYLFCSSALVDYQSRPSKTFIENRLAIHRDYLLFTRSIGLYSVMSLSDFLNRSKRLKPVTNKEFESIWS